MSRLIRKHLLPALMLASMLLIVPGTLAAQETTAEAVTGPSGLMVLIFLLGVGGVVLVGGRWLIRDSFQPDDE